jgi:hypothetical protein
MGEWVLLFSFFFKKNENPIFSCGIFDRHIATAGVPVAASFTSPGTEQITLEFRTAEFK